MICKQRALTNNILVAYISFANGIFVCNNLRPPFKKVTIIQGIARLPDST
jgi:hypothetical protein